MEKIWKIYSIIKPFGFAGKVGAAHFEVSPHTIYRGMESWDMESLSMAGIPICAGRGKEGGTRLMEQFVPDKLLLSEEEQRKFLATLASLREIGGSGEEKTLEKLEAEAKRFLI